MIRENTLFCKLLSIKNTAFKIVMDFFSAWNIALEFCPHCGAKGCCEKYGEYTRSFICIENGKTVYYKITIPRVICKSCSTEVHKCTHGVIPDVIIPYVTYSLLFILQILFYYFCTNMKLNEICDKYNISHVQVYRWIDTMHKHKKEWLGVLTSAEIEPGDFLRSLLDLECYSEEFSDPFLRRTTISFLQTHANPTNCRYPKFP